ncbi:g1965 [Coccomyxa viridis]|uniref:G1965 protein n=1 Tax=Coccomyxa viridis TaxID=1274662 RepID=A0ABP1FLE3_9CHLO
MNIKLVVLCCWANTILNCADAITPGGKRQAPGLIPLNPVGIYGSLDTALKCMQMVRQQAGGTLNFADTLPNCLRIAYHDSSARNTTSPGGANGSIMNELDDPLNNPGNLGLAICHAYLKALVPLMRNNGTGPCAKLTFADAIQWVAEVAVELAGGPATPMLPGREDCGCFDNTNIIADECAPATDLISFWSEAGMTDPVKASAALSGSHSLGNIRSTTAHDAANGAGFGGAGPVCIGSPGPMTAQPNVFDNHYFKEIYNQNGRAGYLYSDRNLAAINASTLDYVKEYANDDDAFFRDWVPQFQEMSLLGVDPKPAGFNITSGFLPGGIIAKKLPMVPEDNIGFTGTAADFTHPARLNGRLSQSGGQGSFLVAGGH